MNLSACIDVYLLPLENCVKVVMLTWRLCFCTFISQYIFISYCNYNTHARTYTHTHTHPIPTSTLQGKPILSEDDIRSIFSDLKNIHFFHTVMLADLTTRTKDWGLRSRIGEVFLKLMKFMNVYTLYVQNYSRSLHALMVAQRKESFASFLKEAKKSERLRSLDLPSFLIMPVQRIPRWVGGRGSGRGRGRMCERVHVCVRICL